MVSRDDELDLVAGLGREGVHAHRGDVRGVGVARIAVLPLEVGLAGVGRLVEGRGVAREAQREDENRHRRERGPPVLRLVHDRARELVGGCDFWWVGGWEPFYDVSLCVALLTENDEPPLQCFEGRSGHFGC